ncbi:hypothetical protein ACEPAI_4010 [Sanghuangporus weigelae]
MANYLPVLLVSVTAGMPDDAALQPLPRGQVDYLSHDWAEEDVWRSWRSMTKQKHEIANGVRLENASWRTWMKQRNKLKTVSPETLNWLKDSDVTWLYGPLHTAVDWSPPPKPAISPPAKQQSKDDASATSSKSGGNNSLSSPSSTVNLGQMDHQSSRYGLPVHDASVKKPILKHRSIAEMLTSALPPAPIWAEESSEFTDYHNAKHHETKDGSESLWQEEPYTSLSAGRGGRPPLLHTKSDTNILPRFGRGGASKTRVSPPRVALVPVDRELEAAPQPYSGPLSVNQRTGASNNLAEMMFHARGSPGAPTNSASPYISPVPLDNPESSEASTHEVAGIGESRAASSAPASAPQKKHISFNAIVEQCIAIDSGSVPMSPSTGGQSWSSYDDDGYAEDTEDGLYEDVGIGMDGGDSNSEDDSQMEAEDEDEVIEMKPPSRTISSSSLQEYQSALETHHQPNVRHPLSSHYPDRPRLRRSSTGSNKSGRSRNSASASSGSGSGSNSGRVSETNRSRSSVALDREHVTIAPIAPTILKTGGREDNEDGVLYRGGSPLPSLPSTPGIVHGSGTYQGHRGIGNGGMFVGSSGYGYGYGGYGYGEHVSVGRTDVFEHYERGTEAGELVYHSPNGNVYPWGEGDAVRFRMQTGYDEAGSSSELGVSSHQRSHPHRFSIENHSHSSSGPHFTVGSDPGSEGLTTEAEFEYLDDILADTHEDDSVGGNLTRAGTYQARPHTLTQHNHTGQRGEDRVRIAVSHANGRSESSSSHSPQTSQLDLLRDRTPSPDFQPKVNPRIASLRYESGCRSPSPSLPGSDIAATLVPSSPTLAIPTPGISPAHQEEHARMRSPPESPTLHAGLLSPEISPRGRSACASPVSGSATSSSIVRSGSRSGSESRSESRGRSRTRNSSLASSPDQGEPERGRSRSRSIASGANSPLGDSNSPQSRYPPLAIGGIGIGLGIGGALGATHTGREVRDGRGARLYRKTSEDFIGRSAQSDGRGGHSTRGRNREGKRISESLSPPIVGSGVIEKSTTLQSNAVYRSSPIPDLKSQGTRALERESPVDSYGRGSSDKNFSPNEVPLSKSPGGSPVGPLSSQTGKSTDYIVSSNSSSAPVSVSSVATSNGRNLPPSIPEEDEQHMQTSATTQQDASSILSRNVIPPSDSSTTTGSTVKNERSGLNEVKATSNDGPNRTVSNRTAELMSSARTLFGTIWNGS